MHSCQWQLMLAFIYPSSRKISEIIICILLGEEDLFTPSQKKSPESNSNMHLMLRLQIWEV